MTNKQISSNKQTKQICFKRRVNKKFSAKDGILYAFTVNGVGVKFSIAINNQFFKK